MKSPAHYFLLALSVGLLFLALPGGASGASLCSANQTPCSFESSYLVGTKTEMSLTAGTKLIRTSAFNFECSASTMTGETETIGGESKPVEVPLSGITLGSCGTGCTYTAPKPGRLSVQGIEGVMNGMVRWSNFELKEACPGYTCFLGGEVSKGIFLKGGPEATLKFENAVIPYQSGVCTSQKWRGQYTLSKPTPLYVSGSTSESITGEGVFCGRNVTPCTPIGTIVPGVYGTGTPITAKLKTGTMSVLDAGFPVIKCEEAGIAGEIENPGGVAEPVIAKVSSLSFGACNCKVSVLKNGRLIGRWSSGTNGTLSLEGVEIASDCGGKECSFAGSISEGLTLEGSASALIKAKEAPVPKKSGIEECKNPKWTAEFEMTSPKALYVIQN